MAYTMAGAYYTPKYRTNRAFKTPKAPIQPTIPAGFEQVHQDLMAYNGTFNLVLNIRSALIKWGKLTDKQWEAVKKCLAPQPVQDPTITLVDKCNIPIVINPTAARYIAKVHNWSVNPCTLAVTQIKSQDRKTITVKVRINWSGNVSVCRCCGKTLTDWKSQATGVGPYCVKRTNIPYVRNKADIARFQKDMEDLCTKIGEVDVVLKRWAIKEGMEAINTTIANTKPVKTKVNAPTEVIIPLQRCDWNEHRRTLTIQKALCTAVNDLTNCVAVHNKVTGATVTFIKQVTTNLHLYGSYMFVSSELANPITLYINE